MVPITENDLALFRERAKTELKSTGDIGRLAWDDVVEALCKEVARLRSASKERGNAAKLREALVKCRDIALQWQADEAAGVAGTTDKPHARSAADAMIDIEFEINAALFATATAEKSSAVGDAAKLREALVQAELFVGNIVRHGHQTLVPGDKCTACDGAEELRDMICAALAEPVRNCDVGTAEEQADRMDAVYCSKRLCAKGKCPLFKPGGDCSLIWAQMHYEEGGAK